jgi:hypothetical protein
MTMARTLQLLVVLLLATPSQSGAAGDCPGNSAALGTERVLSIDPVQAGPVGRKQYPQTLPLQPKEFVLTFDDGPAPGTTDRILAALKHECVRATFFMLGRSATAQQALAKRVLAEGHTVAHHSYRHPLLNRMHHYLGAANVPSTETYCGGAMGFKEGVETLSSDGKRRRAVLPGLAARDQGLVNYFAIYPNFLLTLHPDYMMTITIWPQSPGRTRLVAEWHFHPDEIAKPDFVFEDAIEFWDRTNREDWAISEQSYLGIGSRVYQPGPYSAREQQLWEFDQFVLKAVKHEGHEDHEA